jgi:hypothetical protein
MVATFELHYAAAPRVRSREPNRCHDGFSTGADEPHLLGGRQCTDEYFRQFDLRYRRGPETRALFCCLSNSSND